MGSIGNIITWDDGIFENTRAVPASSPQAAAYFLMKNRIAIVFNTMRNLESLPITLPGTEDILEGNYTGDLDVSSYLKVRSFAKALDALCDDIRIGNFALTKSDICHYHEIAAVHDVDKASLGMFRHEGVKLGNITKYTPCHHSGLHSLWDDGIKALDAIDNQFEKGVVLFLWMARTQFFANCNKRTAFLAMNGVLCSNSICPLIFPADDQNKFMNMLVDYYETGNANGIAETIVSYAVDYRPGEELSSQRMP